MCCEVLDTKTQIILNLHGYMLPIKDSGWHIIVAIQDISLEEINKRLYVRAQLESGGVSYRASDPES